MGTGVDMRTSPVQTLPATRLHSSVMDISTGPSNRPSVVMDISTGPGSPLAVSSPIPTEKVNENLSIPENITNTSIITVNSTDGDGDVSTMGPTYIQCRNSSTATLTVPIYRYSTSVGPQLGTTCLTQDDRVSSLDIGEDGDMKKTFWGTRVSANGTPVNQSISASFDPQTLICTTCVKPHSIMPTDGSGFVLVLSDQSFATCLPGTENCVPIVRIEDASLDELFLICREILEKQPIPPGSLFLVGSTSYLAKVGTTIYAQEWIQLVHKFADRWRIGKVGPVPPVLRESTAGITAKLITELRTWFDMVYGTDIEYLKAAWNQVVCNLASQEPDIELGSNEVYTVPLPMSLTNPCLRPVKFCCSSSTAVTAAFDGGATLELLRALLNGLTNIFNCKAHPGDILERALADPEGGKDIENVSPALLMLGGSHCKILATELVGRGYKVTDLCIPGWTPTETNIRLLEEKIGKLEKVESYIVIADFISNYVFRFEQMDGQLAFPYKVGGKYHMLSKVTVCNRDAIVSVLEKLRNIIGQLPGQKIFLPPLPRYLHKGCCGEEGHCEGAEIPSHAPELLGKCLAVRKTMKEYFVANYVNVWVPDTTQQLSPDCTNPGSLANALRLLYANDNVHLTREGYAKMADYIVEIVSSRLSASAHVSGPSRGHIGEKPSSYFWRGFTSPTGSSRKTDRYFSQKHKSFGGGKWRPSPSPYSGGMGRGGRKLLPPPPPSHGRRRY